MKDEKIDRAIEYYEDHRTQILKFINKKDELNREYRLGQDIIIQKGKELEELSLKISALEIAKNN